MAAPQPTVPTEPRTPQEAAGLLKAARERFEQGALSASEYLDLQARYGPLAERAPPERTPREEKAARLQSALVTLGSVLLAISLFLLTGVLAEGSLTSGTQFALLTAFAVTGTVLGLTLRKDPKHQGTGNALLAVGALLFPLASALSYEAYDSGPERVLPMLLALGAPAGLLHLTHPTRSQGAALVCYLGVLLGIGVTLRLMGIEEPRPLAFAFQVVIIATTIALVALRRQETAREWRWYEGGFAVNALLSGPVFVRGFQVYGLEPFGEYTGMMILLLLGSAYLFYGILDAFPASAISGAILLAAAALWMGGYVGDMAGAVVALLLVASALIAASQLVGVERMREHFQRGP